ncbi:hypothetical protein MMC30_007647 [Trapelia coarctata]|nr:hypothetical protein [Trapelia coarctata]
MATHEQNACAKLSINDYYTKDGTAYSSARPAGHVHCLDNAYNIDSIDSFLGIIQLHDIDLVPVTWQPASKPIGGGRTRDIPKHGDLEKFASSGLGKAFSADVACAIDTLHSCDIIHGDVKPSNVFVFQGGERGDINARVGDFGYSTSLRHKKRIKLPYTIPWYALEVHDRLFTFEEAQRTDVYSFGMLCFWFLFHHARNFPNPQKLVELRESDHDMIREVEALLSRSTDLSDLARNKLAALFKMTLIHDSKHRLGISIMTSAYQLYKANYRVRAQILDSLKAKAESGSDKRALNAAFQCAICYSIGFGGAADQAIAANYLKRNGSSDGNLQAELLRLHQSRSRGFKSEQLSQRGVDFSNIDIDYGVPGELGRKYATCSREVMDLENVLSPDHDLVLTLQSQSARLLAHLGFFEKARDTYQAVYETDPGSWT